MRERQPQRGCVKSAKETMTKPLWGCSPWCSATQGSGLRPQPKVYVTQPLRGKKRAESNLFCLFLIWLRPWPRYGAIWVRTKAIEHDALRAKLPLLASGAPGGGLSECTTSKSGNFVFRYVNEVGNKKPALRRVFVFRWVVLTGCMVGAEGFEPTTFAL